MKYCNVPNCANKTNEGDNFCTFHNYPENRDKIYGPTTVNRILHPPPDQILTSKSKSLAQLYPKYYKSVKHLEHIDVYAVHSLFQINDPSGAIQHASKKLLLSGARTGGKSAYQDIKEARDTLNRWLELNEVKE